MSEPLTSRFFRNDDPASQQFVFALPDAWWSRKYEYPWASQFCDSRADVLDAACGLEHPLKFHLLDHCRKTCACDLDPRLSDPEAIRTLAVKGYHISPASDFPERYLQEIDYAVSSLTALPYKTAQFDRIFCISVLEHLTDRLNRFPGLRCLESWGCRMRRDIRDSLIEFKRVLKDDGLIVLTFDYPCINLDYLRRVVDEVGLAFAGPVDFSRPENAIHFAEKNLHCFRAVLAKS